MLLLLQPKNKSFVPEAVRYAIQSNEDSGWFPVLAALKMKVPQQRRVALRRRTITAERRPAKTEATVSEQAKVEQCPLHRLPGRGDQPFRFIGRKTELGNRAGHIPGDVLA